MNKRLVLGSGIFIIIAFLVGGIFLSKERENQRIQVEIDPNADHWQTKETEAFSIKFPKEWYWMESDPTKHGYPSNSGRSYVITNNPDFDIDKYSDIGTGAGIGYPLTLTDDTEIVITFSGVAITSESGSPRDSIDWEIKKTEEDINPDADCSYVDRIENIPPAAYCSFIDENGQKVQVYYVAYDKITYAFTSRTTSNDTAMSNDLLEKIAKSFVIKNASSRSQND